MSQSRKQEIYCEILFWALPRIRNICSSRFLWRKYRKECFGLSQLTHRIEISICDPLFTDNDYSFLEHAVPEYCKEQKNTLLFAKMVSLFGELYSEVPEQRKGSLTWSPN